MATYQSSTAPVRIERFGKARVGFYTVSGGIVSVVYEGAVKSAQTGEFPPLTTAQALLRELVNKVHGDLTPQMSKAPRR